MSEKWVMDNLNVVPSMLGDGLAIDWGNGLMTEVSDFINMFGEVIEQAINDGKDVRQAIADNDDGRGYSDLILN